MGVLGRRMWTGNLRTWGRTELRIPSVVSTSPSAVWSHQPPPGRWGCDSREEFCRSKKPCFLQDPS